MSLKVRCLVGLGVISLLMVVGLSAAVNPPLVEAAKNQDREGMPAMFNMATWRFENGVPSG